MQCYTIKLQHIWTANNLISVTLVLSYPTASLLFANLSYHLSLNLVCDLLGQNSLCLFIYYVYCGFFSLLYGFETQK